jgi:5'-nucleotidase / UDP-sugar diphosphatase
LGNVATAVASPAPAAREVTILYTNDFHSAIDPIPAYWRPGSPKLGGAAQLSTLINRVRARESPVFLFDSGDLFTGTFSYATRGEALMRLWETLKVDAMAIGNHEFDYGSAVFTPLMEKAAFPVLGANLYLKATGARYARPWVIVERGGVRVGVIGIIGKDAASVTLPSGIADLDVRDPLPEVEAAVKELRPRVDLVVVLAHQGKTGPMQSDAEGRPEVQRDVDEDLRLAGAVPGIDVFVGGHAHRGLEQPLVHPRTGTLVVQTYGYGTRLGYLKLRLEGGRVVSHAGELLEVRSDELPPDPAVVALLEPYRRKLAAEYGGPVATLERRLVRDYNRESSLGCFVADVMREATGAEIAFENAGGLRADLPEGRVGKPEVLDALPFPNALVTLEMDGRTIRDVLEQGLTLERGLVQISGLTAVYDLQRPAGQRLVETRVGGQPLVDEKTYRVATNSFLAEGGDLYSAFLRGKPVTRGGLLADVVLDFLRREGKVALPEGGRWIPAPVMDELSPQLAAAIDRVRWTPERVDVLIREMPKAELHLHLDGALSPETIARLASDLDGSPLQGKTPAEIAKLSVVSEARPSLARVLEAFGVVYPVLRRPAAVREAAYELIRRAARSNVKYVEVRFAPGLLAGPGFTSEAALQAALDGLERGGRDFGIEWGVIICLLRPGLMDMEGNTAMLDLALAYRQRGVVGVDVAGDEAAGPLSAYEPLLREASAAGLGLTVHAGEVAGSHDLGTALLLGVDRIGHATDLPNHPRLQRVVAERRIPIEVNLTSNLRTSEVKDLRAHPAQEWRRLGIPLAVSTDDPGVFDIELVGEYGLLQSQLGFGPRDLVAVALQAVDAAFVTPEQRRKMRESFEGLIRDLLDLLASDRS